MERDFAPPRALDHSAPSILIAQQLSLPKPKSDAWIAARVLGRTRCFHSPILAPVLDHQAGVLFFARSVPTSTRKSQTHAITMPYRDTYRSGSTRANRPRDRRGCRTVLRVSPTPISL